MKINNVLKDIYTIKIDTKILLNLMVNEFQRRNKFFFEYTLSKPLDRITDAQFCKNMIKQIPISNIDHMGRIIGILSLLDHYDVEFKEFEEFINKHRNIIEMPRSIKFLKDTMKIIV